MAQQRVIGTVKTWMTDRGFGFASVDGIEDDVFLWGTEMPCDPTTIQRGQRYSFEVWPGKEGKKAKAKHILPADDPKPTKAPAAAQPEVDDDEVDGLAF